MDFRTEDEIKKSLKTLAMKLRKMYCCNIKIEINFKGEKPLINVTVFDV